jgi:hypothetical protein
MDIHGIPQQLAVWASVVSLLPALCIVMPVLEMYHQALLQFAVLKMTFMPSRVSTPANGFLAQSDPVPAFLWSFSE